MGCLPLPLAHLCLWGLLSVGLCVSLLFLSFCAPAPWPGFLSSCVSPSPPTPCPGPTQMHGPNPQCLPCLAPGEENIYLGGGSPPSPRPPLRLLPEPIHHPSWRLGRLICHCRLPPHQAIIPSAMARQRPEDWPDPGGGGALATTPTPDPTPPVFLSLPSFFFQSAFLC